jgi:hypothetical protein
MQLIWTQQRLASELYLPYKNVSRAAAGSCDKYKTWIWRAMRKKELPAGFGKVPIPADCLETQTVMRPTYIQKLLISLHQQDFNNSVYCLFPDIMGSDPVSSWQGTSHAVKRTANCTFFRARSSLCRQTSRAGSAGSQHSHTSNGPDGTSESAKNAAPHRDFNECTRNRQ